MSERHTSNTHGYMHGYFRLKKENAKLLRQVALLQDFCRTLVDEKEGDC